MTLFQRIATAVLTTSAMLAGAVPVSAAPAAVIRCRTVVVYNKATNTTTAVVRSNHPTRAAVHSFRFVFSDGDDLWVRTFDRRTNRGRGYGPALRVSGYAFQAIGWQSGTRCVAGGVTNAG